MTFGVGCLGDLDRRDFLLWLLDLRLSKYSPAAWLSTTDSTSNCRIMWAGSIFVALEDLFGLLLGDCLRLSLGLRLPVRLPSPFSSLLRTSLSVAMVLVRETFFLFFVAMRSSVVLLDLGTASNMHCRRSASVFEVAIMLLFFRLQVIWVALLKMKNYEKMD